MSEMVLVIAGGKRWALPTARVREVGCAGAVTRAQTTNAIGAEPARAVARALEKLLELDPRRGSISNELV